MADQTSDYTSGTKWEETGAVQRTNCLKSSKNVKNKQLVFLVTVIDMDTAQLLTHEICIIITQANILWVIIKYIKYDI